MLFIVGAVLQALANLSLAFGGLMLAFYTLPDDEKHEVRRLLISRLTWSLVLLGTLFCAIFYYSPPAQLVPYIRVENLSDDEVFGLLRCFFSDYFRTLSEALWGDDGASNEISAEVRECFQMVAGRELPKELGEISVLNSPIRFTSSRMTGVIISIALMILILLIFQRRFLQLDARNKNRSIANCFSAIIVGVFLQIFLQGAGDILVSTDR